MRPMLVALFAAAPALAAAAGPDLEARWVGTVAIPGRELSIVVDLAPDASGAWAGSIIVAGLGIKGAPLANLVVGADEVAFDLGEVLASPADGPARIRARRAPGGELQGEMTQGGNLAQLSLRRAGAAQVDAPPRGTPVSPAVEGRWEGEFELGGYPRRVTLTVENRAEGAATATLVIVGRQTTALPIDIVSQEAAGLRIESRASRVTYEARLDPARDELAGTLELGSVELPLRLRRAPGRAS